VVPIFPHSPGAFLLIVDSAGDFSEIRVGTKTYMVYTLLDYIKGFKKILMENARWYRFPPGLSFPVKLQNQRYFWRLYRKD
jgi:25S rRNA (uracil2843-N3)-methyltransferase